MMNQKVKEKILYNCYFQRTREGEQIINEHVFSFQVAGKITIMDAAKTYIAEEGDFRFSRRNHLAKFIKQPPENGEFKSLSIYLDQDILRKISNELNIKADGKYINDDTIISLPDHPLYKNLVDSLLVYVALGEEERSAIMDLKIKEAVLILLKINPELKNVLFDFNEPGKIDLEAFMLKNFHFNVDLNRFAYLCGRSLSTFKRDFEKIFNQTPSRWLIKKRLQQAYYLLTKQGKKVNDVYLEVGFEDLSHFSFAFKKQYGVAPSSIK